MPSVDFQEFLERKYQVLQQQADATSQLKGAQAENLQTQTQLAPDIAKATIGRQAAASGFDVARSGLVGAQTVTEREGNKPFGELAARLALRLRGQKRSQRQRGSQISRGALAPSTVKSVLDPDPRKPKQLFFGR